MLLRSLLIDVILDYNEVHLLTVSAYPAHRRLGAAEHFPPAFNTSVDPGFNSNHALFSDLGCLDTDEANLRSAGEMDKNDSTPSGKPLVRHARI